MALIRGLRLILLLGLAALVGGILASIAAGSRTARAPSAERPAAPPGRGPVVQRGTGVEVLRTRAGQPALRLRAAESRTYADGELEFSRGLFRLIGPDGRETLVDAPRAVVTSASGEAAAPAPAPGLRDGAGSWLLDGGVTIRAPDGMTLMAPALIYVEADGQARTNERIAFARGPASGSSRGLTYDVGRQRVLFREEVAASMTMGGLGKVSVAASTATYAIGDRRFEMIDYRATTERGEVLAGALLAALLRESGGIERLEGDRGFTLESSHSEPDGGRPSPLARLLALEGRRTLSGRRLAMSFGETEEPAALEVEGDASLSARGVLGSSEPSILSAETLHFDLTGGELTRARAEGEVDLKGAPRQGRSAGLRLLGDNLEAAFDPNAGSIVRVEGEGEIHLSDEGMESQGSRAFLDPNADAWTLSGEDGAPASTIWLGRTIQAQWIEVDRRRETLSARGGVRAGYRPPPPPAGGGEPGDTIPFFAPGETIYAMAGSMVLAEGGKVVHYEDRVRLWQGESRVEADQVALDETRGTLVARGGVVSAFRQPPAPRAVPSANPSDAVVTIAASTMSYERTARRIVYEGPALLTQGALRLRAGTVTVLLGPDGRAAERLEAAGDVEVVEGGRLGRGDRLVAEMEADTMTLTGSGRQASVQDETGQQVVRGRSLTIDRTGDRILVESEAGGRTWITLKPR